MREKNKSKLQPQGHEIFKKSITLNKKEGFKILCVHYMLVRLPAGESKWSYYFYLCFNVEFHRCGGKPCFGLSVQKMKPQTFSALIGYWNNKKGSRKFEEQCSVQRNIWVAEWLWASTQEPEFEISLLLVSFVILSRYLASLCLGFLICKMEWIVGLIP